MIVMKLKKGLVHVYTGNGKGKTTAAFGLALRAIGKGLKVYCIQFMKGSKDYGEVIMAERIPNLTLRQFGRDEFVDRKNPAEIDIQLARDGLEHAREVMKGNYDVLILDEINCAIEWNLIKVDEVIELIESRPDGMEIILTGRYAHSKLIEIADYVTEMKEIKHPFIKGVKLREGIEF